MSDNPWQTHQVKAGRGVWLAEYHIIGSESPIQTVVKCFGRMRGLDDNDLWVSFSLAPSDVSAPVD
jgi:hypothetical protein